MSKPPPGTPNSDIDGVDRDWRPGLTSRKTSPDPGAALERARRLSAGRPDSGIDEAKERHEETDNVPGPRGDG